jgi:CRP/FNR family transcriptional regulator
MPFDTSPAQLNTACQLCPVQDCLGRRGGAAHAAAWSGMLAPRMAVMPGATALYHSGDRLKALYSVRGGCIKAFTVDAEGNERIRGFYLPGDLVGLDALGAGVCLSTAAAVIPSQVCVAPLVDLRQLMLKVPELAQRMMDQTSRELALALALSGDYSAEQRMAAFLVYMRERMGNPEILQLPMAQRDIGNYLRLATETVCRTLKSLERKGWIKLGGHAIRIVAEKQLQAAADPVGIPHGELKRAA